MRKILVIDDDPLVARTLALLLGKIGGYRVTLAFNGRAGLKNATDDPPDMVITDVVMADGSGIDLITQFRTTNPDLPIIAMSGSPEIAQNDLLRMTMAAGASDFLRKPFRNSQLIEAIGRYLGPIPQR